MEHTLSKNQWAPSNYQPWLSHTLPSYWLPIAIGSRIARVGKS